MRRPSLLFVCFALLLLTTAAHATTMYTLTSTIHMSGNGNSGTYTITGTVNVTASTSNGFTNNEITGGSFTIDGLPGIGDVTYTYSSDSVQGTTTLMGGHTYISDYSIFAATSDTDGVTINSGSNSQIFLETNPTLTGGGNIMICDTSCTVGTNITNDTPTMISVSYNASPYYQAGSYSGTLGEVTMTQTSPTPTPEPSSLLMLGTGMLGAAGLARRKFLKK